MSKAFLLRFQEPTEDATLGDIRCGTQTGTRIEAEQTDPDRSRTDLAVVPSTKDRRQVPTEHADTNCQPLVKTHVWATAKVVMATRTKTAIEIESDDRDPGRQRLQVLPRCSSY